MPLKKSKTCNKYDYIIIIVCVLTCLFIYSLYASFVLDPCPWQIESYIGHVFVDHVHFVCVCVCVCVYICTCMHACLCMYVFVSVMRKTVDEMMQCIINRVSLIS